MAEVARWTLQRGVYQALAGSVDLTTLLGGVRVYDDAPQAAPYPFITLGQSVVRDWSTGTEDGAEHNLTLHVWSGSAARSRYLRSSRRSGPCCMTNRSCLPTIIWSICATNSQRRGSTRTATPSTTSCAIAP